MREFEILPTEREFSRLAMEYNKLKLRKNILDSDKPLSTDGKINTNADKEKSIKEIPSEITEKAELLLALLKKLYSLSPYALRTDIRNIITLKKTDKLIDAEKNIIAANRDATYCSLLNTVISEQTALLKLLAECADIPHRTIDTEIIAMQSITILKCYCADFNMRNSRF